MKTPWDPPQHELPNEVKLEGIVRTVGSTWLGMCIYFNNDKHEIDIDRNHLPSNIDFKEGDRLNFSGKFSYLSIDEVLEYRSRPKIKQAFEEYQKLNPAAPYAEIPSDGCIEL